MEHPFYSRKHHWAMRSLSGGPYTYLGWTDLGPLTAARKGLFPSRRRHPPGRKIFTVRASPGLPRRAAVACAKPEGRRSFPVKTS